MDPVRELKVRAEILQRRLASGDPGSVARLRALPELRGAAAPGFMAREARRKHCLAVVARECGFASWEHARRVLDSDARETDFGTLLYPAGPGASGTLHPWFAASAYEEARASLDAAPPRERLFLLAYRRHFFLAGRDLVRSLGFDPDDDDWAAIGWDWARPANPGARRRLYAKRIGALRATP
jgi:hypothetical protein